MPRLRSAAAIVSASNSEGVEATSTGMCWSALTCPDRTVPGDGYARVTMHPVLAIAIETSNPTHVRAPGGVPSGDGAVGPGVAVGLVTPGEPDALRVLSVEALRPVGRHEDDQLACVDRCVRAAGAKPRDVRLVAVSIGPGGYTALRIACAAGKMIALGAGPECRCVGVATSDALVEAVRERLSPGAGVAVALAGKGASAFVTTYATPDAARARELVAGRLLDAEGFADVARSMDLRTLIGDAHAPEAVRQRATSLGVAVMEPSFDPRAVLRVASVRAWGGAEGLMPLYGREPEAVSLWRARLESGGGPSASGGPGAPGASGR
jgi:tRNA A37 threonylcarbamoyladenosine modification protein TsaB